MGLKDAFRLGRIRDFPRVKACPLVFNRHQHAAVWLTEAAYDDSFLRVLPVAMDDGIDQRLAQS